MEASSYVTSTGLILLVIFFLLGHVSSQQSVSLTSSLNNQYKVRRGENIIFQCITTGSSTLAWKIGPDDHRSEFVIFDNIGSTTHAHGDVYNATASLINVSFDGHQIESRLNIVVQSSIPIFSITCLNVGTEESRSISLQFTDTPVLTCDGRTVCPGDFRNFICEIRDSSILAWENDEYIGPHGNQLELLSAEPVGTIKVSEINTGVFANLTDNYVENGVQVLKCKLIISNFLYHPDAINVSCVNIDLGTEDSFEITVNDNNCDGTIESSTIILYSGAKEMDNGIVSVIAVILGLFPLMN